MAEFNIPANLLAMVAERRVIPFVGAGFSSILGLPSWDELLAQMAEEFSPALPIEEIRRYCDGSRLQMAEYFYLKNDKAIGPLRHRLSQALQSVESALTSTAHVELVNLGAPQIYTTNYDNMIEDAFKHLQMPFDTVAIPKHIALANSRRTQIIKYHGDLRYESTLVLTESSYYNRLDLESPMDLKFRSDLLGKSVLFIGYSFQDINIRVIWFKLMQMMKDVPEIDRPVSYMVRLQPNPVLEALDESVGLRTIVLDPTGRASTADERRGLLEDFMLELCISSAPNGVIPGQAQPMFMSGGAIAAIRKLLPTMPHNRAALPPGRKPASIAEQRRIQDIVSHAANRQIPPHLSQQSATMIKELSVSHPGLALRLSLTYLGAYSMVPALATAILRMLLNASTREELLRAPIDWNNVWGQRQDEQEMTLIARRVISELDYHQGPNADYDLAYAVDLTRRILANQFGNPTEETKTLATKALTIATKLYPVIKDYQPSATGKPSPSLILQAITKRVEEEQSNEAGPTDDDIPF